MIAYDEILNDAAFQAEPEEVRRSFVTSVMQEFGKDKDYASQPADVKFKVARDLETRAGLYKAEEKAKFEWVNPVDYWKPKIEEAAKRTEQAASAAWGWATQPLDTDATSMYRGEDVKDISEAVPIVAKNRAKRQVSEIKDPVFSSDMGLDNVESNPITVDDVINGLKATREGWKSGNMYLGYQANKIVGLQNQLEAIQKAGGKREDLERTFKEIRDIQADIQSNFNTVEEYQKKRQQLNMLGSSIGQMAGDTRELVVGAAAALGVGLIPGLGPVAATIAGGAIGGAGAMGLAEYHRKHYLNDIFSGKAKDWKDYIAREGEAMAEGAKSMPAGAVIGATMAVPWRAGAELAIGGALFTGVEAVEQQRVPEAQDFARNAALLAIMKVPVHGVRGMKNAYEKYGMHPDDYTNALMESYKNLEAKPDIIVLKGEDGKITAYRTTGPRRRTGEKSAAEVEAENMIFDSQQVEVVGGLAGDTIGPAGVPVFTLAKSNEFKIQHAKNVSELLQRSRTIDAEIADLRTQELTAKSREKASIKAQIDVLSQEKKARDAELRALAGANSVADGLIDVIANNTADQTGLMTALMDKKTMNRIRSGIGTSKGDISYGYEINLGFMGDWQTVFNMFANRGVSNMEMRSLFTKLYLGIENAVTENVLKGFKGAGARHDAPDAFRDALKKAGYTDGQIDIVRQSQDLRIIGRRLGFNEKELNAMMMDQQTNKAVLDGIAPQDKAAIEKHVKELGNYEVVKAIYWKEDTTGTYARKFAREFYKAQENAPKTLQVEPGGEVTIVKDSEVGIRQYKPTDEALAFIDGKTREISESGVAELRKMYKDAKDKTDPVGLAKIARALQEVNFAIKERGRTVSVYDEAGQKVGEKKVEVNNEQTTAPVAAKIEVTTAEEKTTSGYKKPKAVKTEVAKYEKEKYTQLRERTAELEEALTTFDGLRQTMTPEEWANYKLPTDTLPAPERIKLLEKEYAEVKGQKQAMRKLKPAKGTTLGFMGAKDNFLVESLPNMREVMKFFKFLSTGPDALAAQGKYSIPSRITDTLTDRDVVSGGAWLLSPDGRWIYTSFNTHNAASKAYYTFTNNRPDRIWASDAYGDLCRDTGVMRVRFGMSDGMQKMYVDTEGVMTKQQYDAINKALGNSRQRGVVGGLEWDITTNSGDYVSGLGVESLRSNIAKMGWFLDTKDMGYKPQTQRGFTLSFMGAGEYEKVPGLLRKEHVNDLLNIKWADIVKFITDEGYTPSVMNALPDDHVGGMAWRADTVSSKIGKGKWFTKWNDVEMGSYFIDREGRVFGSDEAIHGQMVYDAVEVLGMRQGLTREQVRLAMGDQDLLARYLIDTGYVRLNLSEGAAVQGYVKLSKPQIDAIESMKRVRKLDWFEFEFGNETTGMTVQGDKRLWNQAIKSADIVSKNEKAANLIDRMYRWTAGDEFGIGFMGTQEINRGLDAIANWARKTDRPGIALAAQLKDQFKKLCFYPDAPPNLANAIRKEVIGGLNGVMRYRQELVKAITDFDGKKASDADIQAATEIVFLKDQLSRTLANKGNPDITLREAEGLLTDAMRNASQRAQEMASRMREVLDANAADLIRRGKLDPDSMITDYAPHLVEDYTPEWAPIFNIPKKLSRPFRGYTKEAKGSTRSYRQDFNAIADFLTMAKHHNLLEDFMLKWADHYDVGKTFTEDMKLQIFGRDGWQSAQKRADIANQWHQKPGTIIDIEGKRYIVWSPDTPFTKELYPQYEKRSVMDEETGSYLRDVKGDYYKEEKFTGLMVGKTKRTYLIPEEVAGTFKHMITPFGNSVGDYAVTVANRLTMNFKELAILANYPKFNFNNLIGDSFMLTMQHPAKMEFIGNIPEAVKLAYKTIYGEKKFGAMTPDEMAFMKWVDEQDILGGTIKAEFRRNVTADPSTFRKFLDKVESVSDYREAVLRLANAKWLYDEMQSGRGGQAVNKYRHINTEGIELITDQLGKIARDSAIDYQRTSRDFSRYIKNFMFPFGKWYFDSTRLVWKYAKEHPFQVMLALNALPATAFVLNNRDSDTQRMEAQLPAKVREQLHFIVGRNPDGSIKTWTFQTPQDALIGTKVFTMAWNQMNYVYNGQKDITTAARDLIKDWGVREAESVAFLMSPITRFMKGLYSGKDPWDGRNVYSTNDRDKMSSWDKRQDEALFFMKTMVPMLGASVSDYNDKAQPVERTLLNRASGFAGWKALGITDYDPQAHLTVKNGKVINYDTLEKLGEAEAKDAMLMHKIKDDWVRSSQTFGQFMQSEQFKKRLSEFKEYHQGNLTPDAVNSFAKRVVENTANDPSTVAAWFDNLAWQAERAGKSDEAKRFRELKQRVRTYQMFLQLKRTDKTVRDMIDDTYNAQNFRDYEHARRMDKLDQFMKENQIAK